ncbi:MAG TPA: cytochrome c [Xanthobacteraceae bacterium]|nr:cytochrome c [Xanthobacteraceae bacterium]
MSWQPAWPALANPSPTFDPAIVARGEKLAHLGNCAGCHMAQGGRPFAGGRPLETPFGTVFTTNITPDPETGIGRWSRKAFVRAMREGVARTGDLLYPAFPYDHFTHASDPDIDALYAFLMTRPAVQARAPADRLKEPFGFRPLLAGWNLLFLHKGPLADDPGQSTEWNRGRALAEGLAHCGGCHTPRNELGAERSDHAYDGAWIEGWYAPPLNINSPAVRPWTAEDLFAYLRTGLSATHAAAAGPMGSVTRGLAQASEDDVRAIAVYFASLMAHAPAAQGAPPTDKGNVADAAHPEAAALFAGACAICHAAGAPMMQEGRPSLAWGTPLHEDTPNDTIQIIVQGLAPPAGRSGPTMPAYGDSFSDRQLADITAYLRARYTDKPPWPDVAGAVAQVRKGGSE